MIKDYSNYILRKRKRLKLTQVKFAERLGVAFQTVNRWENGHHEPSNLALNVIRHMK